MKRWRSAFASSTTMLLQIKYQWQCVKKGFWHEPNNGRIKIKELTCIASYTDGSLLNNKTGRYVHKRVIYNGSFYLWNIATVFQAEITAIRKSAGMLLKCGWENQIIRLFSDSQASLASL